MQVNHHNFLTIVVNALGFGTSLIDGNSMDLHPDLRVNNGVGFVSVDLGKLLS